MLSAVADFKAPVFEPGGSMQQGMYTPKGRIIWLQTILTSNRLTFLKCHIGNVTEVSGAVNGDLHKIALVEINKVNKVVFVWTQK